LYNYQKVYIFQLRFDFLTFAITGPSTVTLSVGLGTSGQLTGAGKQVSSKYLFQICVEIKKLASFKKKIQPDIFQFLIRFQFFSHFKQKLMNLQY
jgi:hypothetical protein